MNAKESKKYHEDKLAGILPELQEMGLSFGRKFAEAMGCILELQKPLRLSATRYPFNGQRFPVVERIGGQSVATGIIDEMGPEAIFRNPKRFAEGINKATEALRGFGLAAKSVESSFLKFYTEPIIPKGAGISEPIYGGRFSAEELLGSRHKWPRVGPLMRQDEPYKWHPVAWPGPECVHVMFNEEIELWGLIVNGYIWAHGSDETIRRGLTTPKTYEEGWHIATPRGSMYERAKAIAKDARDAVMRLPEKLSRHDGPAPVATGCGAEIPLPPLPAPGPLNWCGSFMDAAARRVAFEWPRLSVNHLERLRDEMSPAQFQKEYLNTPIRNGHIQDAKQMQARWDEALKDRRSEYQGRRRTGESPDAYFKRAAHERAAEDGKRLLNVDIKVLAETLREWASEEPTAESSCEPEALRLVSRLGRVGMGIEYILPNPTVEEAPKDGAYMLFVHKFGKLHDNTHGRVYYSELSDNWVVELVSVGIIGQGCTNRVLEASWLQFRDGAEGKHLSSIIEESLMEATHYVKSRGEALLGDWLSDKPSIR